MTSTPAGPLTTPTNASGQKARPGVDTSSTFASFKQAAKEKADRWAVDKLLVHVNANHHDLQREDAKGAAGDQQEGDGEEGEGETED